MYTTDLKVNYKNKCERCGSWVNATDRYCPMCGYKVVTDFNPKYDNLPDEEFTQRLSIERQPSKHNVIAPKENIQAVKLSFLIPDLNYEFSIETKKYKLYIGSSADCSIVVKRNYVSRFHAMLTYDPKTSMLYVSDNHSTNGTFLNGKKLETNEPTEVRPNSKIGLSEKFIVEFLSAENIG